jgi:hypothetical protein
MFSRFLPTQSRSIEAGACSDWQGHGCGSAVAARLSVEQQRRIADDETELAHIVEAAVAELAAKPSHALAEVSVEKPVEVSRGAGLGPGIECWMRAKSRTGRSLR